MNMIQKFHLRRYAKEQKGQSLVELALILPIIVLLMFGTVEFGRVFYSYITVTSAVRKACVRRLWGKRTRRLKNGSAMRSRWRKRVHVSRS
jgi:Flp pilus assembly protein TadG